MKNKFLSNILVAFLSQGISLIMSLLMSFLLPKMLGVNQYSYSQLFIFYVGYVGFFHLGINDGIYLRLGGQDYNKLNYGSLGTEFKAFILIESIIALLICSIGLGFISDPNRKIILALTAVYMVLNNIALYLGYIFQAVDETKWFSYSVMIDRIAIIVFIVLLIILKQDTFLPFIATYTFSKLLSLVYCIQKGNKIVFSHIVSLKSTIKNLYTDASSGMKLMISNIISMLIIGSGRFIIDDVWGIESFGKISLSFSLTNFFLVFIQQVSMVMFPALRKIGDNQKKELFILLRNGVNLVTPVILVLYIPLQYLLSLWLPAYKDSLFYLAFLLPLCIFDGKMQMLFNTYFKVLRQEKRLMSINLMSFGFSIVLCVISGYVLHNKLLVVCSMVCAIIVRSIISDWLLTKSFEVGFGSQVYIELIMIAAYVLVITCLDGLYAFFAVLCAYLVYLLLNIQEIKTLLSNINRLVKN